MLFAQIIKMEENIFLVIVFNDKAILFCFIEKF